MTIQRLLAPFGSSICKHPLLAPQKNTTRKAKTDHDFPSILLNSRFRTWITNGITAVICSSWFHSGHFQVISGAGRDFASLTTTSLNFQKRAQLQTDESTLWGRRSPLRNQPKKPCEQWPKPWLYAAKRAFYEKQQRLGGGLKQFFFTPIFGEMTQFDEHIFHRGRNHQLATYLEDYRLYYCIHLCGFYMVLS